MHRFVLFAGIVALAACSNEKAPEPTPVENTKPAQVLNQGPGTFDVAYGDGRMGTFSTSEDGTYSLTIDGQTISGSVKEVGGRACFDPSGDDAPERCWTAGPVSEDGSWTATADDGETASVRRVDDVAATSPPS